LCAARYFFPVRHALLVANNFERLPRPPRKLKDFPLLIMKLLQSRQFVLEFVPVAQKLCLAQQAESQFRRRNPRAEFPALHRVDLAPVQVHLFQQMTDSRHLLVGRAQSQLLLMFEALPQM